MLKSIILLVDTLTFNVIICSGIFFFVILK